MIHEVKRQQVIAEDVLKSIEEKIAAARRGEIVDVIFACDDADDGTYFRACQFKDGWRVLGALEHMKDAVLRGMGDG